MPASYVHQCVARDAARQLDLFHGDQLRAALTAGSEGPDPFFFALLSLPGTPSASALGGKLHVQRTGDFLLALAKACAGSDITRAFCCGFLSHYATDTTFHPFVYAHSTNPDGSYSGTAHCTLEHALEVLHYRRRGHASGVPTQMMGYARLTKGNKDAIARALSAAIDEVFPERRLSYARVRQSFEEAVFLCALLRSPSGRRYQAFGALAGIVGRKASLHAHMIPVEPPSSDIANDAHAVWRSPWQPDIVRTESFGDLYAAAIARTKELIPAALRFMSGETDEAALREVTGANSYSSGLDWQTSRPVRTLFPMPPLGHV